MTLEELAQKYKVPYILIRKDILIQELIHKEAFQHYLRGSRSRDIEPLEFVIREDFIPRDFYPYYLLDCLQFLGAERRQGYDVLCHHIQLKKLNLTKSFDFQFDYLKVATKSLSIPPILLRYVFGKDNFHPTEVIEALEGLRESSENPSKMTYLQKDRLSAWIDFMWKKPDSRPTRFYNYYHKEWIL